MRLYAPLLAILLAGCVVPPQPADHDPGRSESPVLPWIEDLDPDYFATEEIVSWNLPFGSDRTAAAPSRTATLPPNLRYLHFELQFNANPGASVPLLTSKYGVEAKSGSTVLFKVEPTTRSIASGMRTTFYAVAAVLDGNFSGADVVVSLTGWADRVDVQATLNRGTPNPDPRAPYGDPPDENYFVLRPAYAMNLTFTKAPSDPPAKRAFDLTGDLEFVNITVTKKVPPPYVGSYLTATAAREGPSVRVAWDNGDLVFEPKWTRYPPDRNDEVGSEYRLVRVPVGASAIHFTQQGWGNAEAQITIKKAIPMTDLSTSAAENGH